MFGTNGLKPSFQIKTEWKKKPKKKQRRLPIQKVVCLSRPMTKYFCLWKISNDLRFEMFSYWKHPVTIVSNSQLTFLILNEIVKQVAQERWPLKKRKKNINKKRKTAQIKLLILWATKTFKGISDQNEFSLLFWTCQCHFVMNHKWKKRICAHFLKRKSCRILK